MRATTVLQRCLTPALDPMHALRRRTLLLAVESLLAGRRLVLRLDRLLGNGRLHAERERLYGGMVRWLIRSPEPVIVVDWCRLKADEQKGAREHFRLKLVCSPPPVLSPVSGAVLVVKQRT